ncbi:RINT-1 / TIP-1-like protein [Elsinoe fawcettii]|nr:RINT-1 / TIP-1-like protein [Elsinoe fawcettii]
MTNGNAQGDVRVQDYLDDQLQTAADLEALDSLLENVRKQQGLLRSQLNEAKEDHVKAAHKSQQYAGQLREQAEAFRKQQADIDRTLLIITQSDTTDDAASRFKDVMQNLHRLEVATSYVEMAEQVSALSNVCLSSIPENMDKAIADYDRLEKLAQDLLTLQDRAEGAAPHLVDLVSGIATAAQTSIRSSLTSELESVLKRIHWPKASAAADPSSRAQWDRQVGRLLLLQQPNLLKSTSDNVQRVSKDEPAVLAPFEVLTQPLALRFQYHFSGDRMTNRLDKPEYFLNHVLDLIDEYAGFAQSSLQSLLLKHYGPTELGSVPAYVDATSAWITALMPILKTKLQSILPQVVKQPSLFSNLVHEVMAFDTKLLEDWNYAPLSTTTPFRGLSHHVLSTMGYFPAWFAIERDFALARYDAIISDRTTGYLDFESVESTSTKPTKAAIRVNDLLETITDRYKPLASFHQKMKFLIDIQIAIFDRFHSRLNEGLEAYLTRTSTVGRTVHGVGQGDGADLSGTKGLDRLCRVYGSAEYLEKAMRDWSEDVFFLDLWEELQYRSQNQGQMKGDLSMGQIAAKTNANVAQGVGLGELQGALFDETAASYRTLRTRSEQVVVDTVNYDLRGALRPYSRVNTWASMSSAGGGTSQTAELDGFIRMLDEYLAFLAKAMGKTALRRIVRQIGLSVQTYIYDNVVLRHTFSTAGAAQLGSDVKGIWLVIDRHAGQRQGATSTQRLVDGVKLLALPVKGEIPVDLSTDGSSDGRRAPDLGLWEVERRLFASNESAREALEDLGIELLSETEAREVLKRRVEIGS